MSVEAVLAAVSVYLGFGVVFAIAFWLFGARRTDPSVPGSSPGFYVLVIPGTIALWPFLAARWRSAATEDRDAGPHHDAGRPGA